ncbi:hypothetical protein [Paramicrobacterium agarici]|uniref:Antitoxin VbhA domain-containing protein n=1 Tax=Paramicrobacterium agarici TaxID=630514 RepID=A0A2A9DTQ8_9MICO|nr:hypothetical protein [Microbacterium agarici]PFG29746.1 hypothetical protein ATJ78_0661 [Microbacterium agarici]
MARTPAAVQQADAEAKARLEFADAALALAGHEVTDPQLREIVERTARNELLPDEAIALIRRHIQG